MKVGPSVSADNSGTIVGIPMTKVQVIEVTEDEADQRLDRWFKHRFPALNHGRLEKLLRTGQIRVDGSRAKANWRLMPGSKVRIPPMSSEPPLRQGRPNSRVSDEDTEWLRSSILYKDKHLIAINKLPGLPVQGGSKVSRHLDGMLDALKFDAKETPRLVHRLDKDTSGVLLLARDRMAARSLTAAFRAKKARKIYWALTVGVPSPHNGEIVSKLEKLPGQGGEKVVMSDEGQRAVTAYAVIERGGNKIAWVAFCPRTGRTHQLRVHATALGTPILGDGKYGGSEAFVSGVSNKMHLHARSIVIQGPSGDEIEITAPLPSHMAETWSFFGFDLNYAEDPFADD